MNEDKKLFDWKEFETEEESKEVNKQENNFDYDFPWFSQNDMNYKSRMRTLREKYSWEGISSSERDSIIEEWAKEVSTSKEITDGYFDDKYKSLAGIVESVEYDSTKKEKKELAVEKKVPQDFSKSITDALLVIGMAASIVGTSLGIGGYQAGVEFNERVDNSIGIISTSQEQNLLDAAKYDGDLGKYILNVAVLRPDLFDLELASCWRNLESYHSDNVYSGDLEIMNNAFTNMKQMTKDEEAIKKTISSGVLSNAKSTPNAFNNLVTIGSEIRGKNSFLEYVFAKGFISPNHPHYQEFLTAVRNYGIGEPTENDENLYKILFEEYEKSFNNQSYSEASVEAISAAYTGEGRGM